MQKRIQAAVYARVSTDKDDQVNSLASQKSYFVEYIKTHKNWELSGVYYDEGVSGTQTGKRAGFNRMIDDALAGKLDLILTKEVCRFARNTVDTLSYTRKLKEAGVGVVFTIDNIDTRDSDGELRLTIMASIAQEESRKTSERVKWGQKRRMEQGVVFGRDMLGYTVEHGALSVNEDEVPIVKAIFHKYTNEGKGTYVIARELLEEGMKPKHSSFWSNTVILRVLRNEKYIGDLCQKKTYTPNYLTHAKKYNDGVEEKVYLENHHEPIIDRDLWDRTQKELAKRSHSKEQKGRHSNRYWCSGKIYCAECTSRFVSRTKKLASGTYRAWRCYQTAAYGSSKTDVDGRRTGCDINTIINEKELIFCMQYCLNLVCRDSEELKKEVMENIKRITRVSEDAINRDRIQQKIGAMEEKKRRVLDIMLEGLITREEMQKQLAWYDGERKRLQKQLGDNLQNSGLLSQQKNNVVKYENAVGRILAFGVGNEILYREVLDRMEIHKGKVITVWLKHLTFGIELKIRSTGRMEGYHTEVLEMEVVE